MVVRTEFFDFVTCRLQAEHVGSSGVSALLWTYECALGMLNAFQNFLTVTDMPFWRFTTQMQQLQLKSSLAYPNEFLDHLQIIERIYGYIF